MIDDVWTIPAWDAIRSKLPENNCGSRVLVTTWIDTVAKACSPDSVTGNYIYYIKPLDLQDSRKLFLRFLRVSCSGEREEEMHNILTKCAGLPIAIVSIAGLLSGYKLPESKNIWERIHRSIGHLICSNLTLEDIRQVLTLSYNHLPHYLKGCVMYLSIFPVNYIISKDRLLWRWMAEGLVEEKRGLTLLAVAESYFEELVCRRIIIGVGVNEIVTDGNKETFRMGDMMLEVIVSKSLEANFVSLVGGQFAGRSYHRIHRLAIHDGGLQGRSNSFFKKTTPGRGKYYRSYIEGMNLNYVRSMSMFDLEEHKLLDRLGEFTLLRVLDLEGSKGLENKHMYAICRMYLIRFLGLKGTNISLVPREVGDLQHLQTLDVYQTRLSGLPVTVTKLKKVERLKFSNKDERATMWKAPRGLSEMKALREVSSVVIDNVKVAQEIADLEQLQEIEVYVDGRSENKEEVRRALACSLGKTYSLCSLSVGDIIEDGHTLDYLIDLPSPPQLRYLRLSGAIARLPDWIGSLASLVEISITSTKLAGDKLLDVLCKAPRLQSVLFDGSFYTDHELVAHTAHSFRALKVIRVPSHDECPRVFRFEEGSMTTLETLEVNFGGNTQKNIVGIEHLKNLKRVQLTGQERNPLLKTVLEQIKAESNRRPQEEQFTVAVRYS